MTPVKQEEINGSGNSHSSDGHQAEAINDGQEGHPSTADPEEIDG
jgi:hypothetical protein